jgi:hypothetical protein
LSNLAKKTGTLLLLIISVSALFWWFNRGRVAPMDAVPGTAIWAEWKTDSMEWKDLFQDPILGRLLQGKRGRPYISSLHRTGAYSFERLWVIPDAGKNPKDWVSIQQGVMQASYEGQTLFRWENPEGQNLTWTQAEGLHLISTRDLLVEQAFTSLKKGTKAWADLKPETRTDSSFFISTGKTLLPLFSACLTEAGDYWGRSLLPLIDWIGGDAQNGRLGISGNHGIVPLASSELSITSLLPSNTFLFFQLSISKTEQASPQLENSPVFSLLQENLASEVAMCWTQALSRDEAQKGPLLFLRIKEGKDDALFLQEWANASGKLGELNYLGFSITQIVGGSFLGDCLNLPLPDSGEAFLTTVGEYILLGPDLRVLQQWIDKYLSGNLLSAEVFDLAVKKNGQLSAQFYIRPDKAGQHLPALFRPECTGAPGILNKLFSSSGFWVGKIFREDRGFTYKLVRKERKEEGSFPLWQQSLNGPVRKGPWLSGSPEEGWRIILEDERGKLYVLAQDGRIVWEKKIEGPVLSVFTPPAESRKQEKLIIQTDQSIIHVDLKSYKELTTLHLPLAQKALTLMQSSPGGTKAFLWPAENRKIYGYQLDGAPLEGWPITGPSARWYQALFHWQLAFQDRIMGVTRAGELFVYDRLGNQISGPSVLEDSLLGELRLTHEGQLFFLNRQGELKSLFLTPEGDLRGLQLRAKEVLDFWVDEKTTELWYLQSEQLISEKPATGERKSIPLPEKARSIFPLRIPGQPGLWMATFSPDREKACLFTSAGELVEGFPAPATRPPALIDLEGDGSPEILMFFEEFVYLVKGKS